MDVPRKPDSEQDAVQAHRTYVDSDAFPGVIGRTVSSSVPAWPEPRRPAEGSPNVVVVLLDDVGFAQFGCYGADIRTPTFDGLAANGVRYTNFHTTALCTPSRACLLTGRNHHDNGTGNVMDSVRGFPGYNGVVPRENGFLSEILRDAGYATFGIGKWHLAPYRETSAGSTRARWPLSRGFDRFYGFLGARTSQWHPDLVHDNHPVDPPRSPADGYHLDEDLADRAIEFVADLRAADPDRPFFLYYCPGAGHFPHHVAPEWADRYAGQFDQGWDRARDAVFRRQLDLGIVPAGTSLPPRPESIPAWDDLNDDQRRLCARQMEVYAGFLEHTDQHIGRVLAFLERIGELENTVVMVTSDNGADANGGPLGSGIAFEGSSVADLAMVEEWGSPNTFPNYSSGWAWVGNTPSRRWKRYVHEGGVRDPLVVHWPRVIRDGGQTRDQYIHIVDIAPTVLDVLGLASPSAVNGVPQSPMQGDSFAHTLDDPSASSNKRIQYYEVGGSRALWSDGWKAVTEQQINTVLDDEALAAQKWELFHLAEDFSEAHDLAAEHPEKVEQLVELWWAQAGAHGVLPLDAARRRGEPRPRRSRYVYYPHAAPVPGAVVPNLPNLSFSVTAHLTPADTAEGVLFAYGGGVYGGCALFVMNRQLHYVHSGVDGTEHHVSAGLDRLADATTMNVAVATAGPDRVTASLGIDDREVASESLPRLRARVATGSWAGLRCGYDSGTAVTPRYTAPFRFTGTLLRVVVDIDDDTEN